MNSEEILNRENEECMLKIQYAARYYFNLAEKLLYFTWIACIISGLSIFFSYDAPKWAVYGIPFSADILVMVFSYALNAKVQSAARLRNFFDAYVLDINYSRFQGHDIREIKEKAEKVYSRFSTSASIELANTGHENPPGVRDWYTFNEPVSGIKSKYECLYQNTWWDKELQPARLTALFIFSIVAVGIYAWFASRNGIFQSVLCSAGLLGNIYGRFQENYKYTQISNKIDGSMSTIESHLTEENVEVLFNLVGERRHINVLGIGRWHKHVANKLSNLYDRITEPTDGG